MIKRLKKRFSKRKAGDKRVQIASRRRFSVANRLERYAEAVALAEAGMHDAAQEIIRREIQQRPKILVIGNEDGFSQPLVDYAVGFAKRMAYEIVALNCVATGREDANMSSPYQKKLFKEFEQRATRGVEPLARRAAEKGVPFQHVVKLGSPAHCIEQVADEVSRLMFVLTVPETTSQAALETNIPVFCLTK